MRLYKETCMSTFINLYNLLNTAMQVMHNRQVSQFKYVTPRETKKHVPNVETVDWDDLSNLDYLTTILKRYL